jgi:putative drug exporter of the RND superfamily
MSGLRPLRNYFYGEEHCFDIPVCAALRSIFDTLDGIDALSDRFGKVTASLDKLNALQRQLMALLPAQVAIQQTNGAADPQELRHQLGHQRPGCAALQNSTAMGRASSAHDCRCSEAISY